MADHAAKIEFAQRPKSAPSCVHEEDVPMLHTPRRPLDREKAQVDEAAFNPEDVFSGDLSAEVVKLHRDLTDGAQCGISC